MTASDAPILSVVVAIASDTTSPTDCRHLGPCLAALRQQSGAPPMEVIVPLPAGVIGVEALRSEYPEARILEVRNLRKYSRKGNSREHHGELIAHGFAAARGSIVGLIEDHERVAPQWSSVAVNALGGTFAGAGGAIENGVDRPLNWALCFCDFLRYQNPLPEGESPRASDANSIYQRSALENIRDIWQQEYHEAPVNAALAARGEKLRMVPELVVYQHRQGLRIGSALRERFVWGRSFGAWRMHEPGARRILWAVCSPGFPLLIMARMSLMAFRKRRTFGPFLRVLPLTTLLTVGWVCGELTGYLTGRALSADAQAAQALARGSQVVT